MKRSTRFVLILSLTLCATSRLIGESNLNRDIAQCVSRNREERGLSSVRHSDALSMAAVYYSSIMRDHQIRDHFLLPSPLKLSVIKDFAFRFGEFPELESVYIFEVLYNLGIENELDAEMLSHIFDSSPPHAEVIYSERTVYIGWGIAKGDSFYWITAYVAWR